MAHFSSSPVFVHKYYTYYQGTFWGRFEMVLIYKVQWLASNEDDGLCSFNLSSELPFTWLDTYEGDIHSDCWKRNCRSLPGTYKTPQNRYNTLTDRKPLSKCP